MNVAAPRAPGLVRRLAAFVYEGVLLFGVVMAVGYVYGLLTQQRHALAGQLGLQVTLFVVIGAYFVWFWSHGGQTLAMKAWRVRLVAADGGPVSPGRALARYLLAWLWFVPALAAAHLSGLRSTSAIFGMLAVGVLAYATLARLQPQRQFWHDVACGTRLVATPPAQSPR